jgi:hypothetical protein
MSKWIDAEWVRDLYADFEQYEGRDDWTTPIANVLAVIDDAPSIDIVTCAECKHMEIKTHPKFSEMVCPIMFATDGTSHDLWAIVQPDDYCSYGQRKESE